jgi:hypothetical protein
MALNPKELSPEVLADNAGAGTVRFKAGEAIEQHDILYFSNMDDAHPVALRASAATAATCRTSLWVSTERIPAGGYGQARNRQVLLRVDAGATAQAAVYLSDTPGAWALTAGTNSVQVGEVVVTGSTGTVLIIPFAFGGLSAGGGGGGGTGGASYLWAPGGGVNAGAQWEELSDVHAAAVAAFGADLPSIEVLVDATAASDTATIDLACEGLNFQSFELIGGAGHAFIRPAIVVPAGITSATELFAGMTGVQFIGNGGQMGLNGGSRFFTRVSAISSTAISPPVIAVTAGFNACDLLTTEVGDDSTPTVAIEVSAGAVLVGSMVSCDVRSDAISDSAGAGSTQLNADSATSISATQNFWIRDVNLSSGYENILANVQSISSPGGPVEVTAATVVVLPTGGVSIALPTVVGIEGRRIKFVNPTNNNDPITLVPDGAETINGASSFTFNTAAGGFSSVELEASGSSWFVS